MRWTSVTLLLGTWLLVAGTAGAAELAKEAAAAVGTGAPTATGEAKVEGFRSAAFGMTEPQLRQAIRKDFPAAGEKVSSEANPAEKTTVLTVVVSDLIPGTGKAKVAYILGYTSKKLIQVNVTWVNEAKSPSASEGLVGAANVLRNYFMAAGYRPDSIVANRQLPNGYVVFRGLDGQSHMVLLVLSGPTGPAETDKTGPPLTLQLSYILDPEHPDVYQVPKGSF